MRLFTYPAKVLFVHQVDRIVCLIDVGFTWKCKKTLGVNGLNDLPSLRSPNAEERRIARAAKELAMDSILGHDVLISTIKRGESRYDADFFIPGKSKYEDIVVDVDGVSYVDFARYIKQMALYDFDPEKSDLGKNDDGS